MELRISFCVGRFHIEIKLKIVKPFSSSLSYDTGGLAVPKIYAFWPYGDWNIKSSLKTSSSSHIFTTDADPCRLVFQAAISVRADRHVWTRLNIFKKVDWSLPSGNVDPCRSAYCGFAFTTFLITMFSKSSPSCHQCANEPTSCYLFIFGDPGEYCQPPGLRSA